MLARRLFLGAACACAAAPFALAQPAPAGQPSDAPSSDEKYVCPPCGCSQDDKEFDRPGYCPDPACGMQLIPKPRQAPPPASTTRP
jgi:hypothetical protein